MFILGSALGFSLSVHLGLKLSNSSPVVSFQSQNTENGILALCPPAAEQRNSRSGTGTAWCTLPQAALSLQVFQSFIVFSQGIDMLGIRDHLFVLFLYNIWLTGPPCRTSSLQLSTIYSDAVITTVVKTKCHQVTWFAVTKSRDIV